MSDKEKGLGEIVRRVRKPGFHGKCDVRLSAEENKILDRLANRNGVSRSEIIRKALWDFWKFNSDGKE